MCWSGWSWNLFTFSSLRDRDQGIAALFMSSFTSSSCSHERTWRILPYLLLSPSLFCKSSSLIKQAHFCIQYFFLCMLGQLLATWVGTLVQLHTCQGWRSCSACHRGMSSPSANQCHCLLQCLSFCHHIQRPPFPPKECWAGLDLHGPCPSMWQWFVSFWNCQGHSIFFPNILPGFLDYALF